MATVQRAADATGIIEVIKTVWGIDAPHAHHLIENKKQLAWTAVEHGQVVGFVSSFLTSVIGGVRRWEVDLLAVLPSAQGKGLGQKLIEATTQDARTYRVKFARGLVRTDNVPAQKTFESAGYTTSGKIYNLYVWPPQQADSPIIPRSTVSILPIDTLTYRGVWVEGLEGQLVSEAERMAGIAAARALAYREGRDHASALVPVDVHLPENAVMDASLQGQYQWWRRS